MVNLSAQYGSIGLAYYTSFEALIRATFNLVLCHDPNRRAKRIVRIQIILWLWFLELSIDKTADHVVSTGAWKVRRHVLPEE